MPCNLDTLGIEPRQSGGLDPKGVLHITVDRGMLEHNGRDCWDGEIFQLLEQNLTTRPRNSAAVYRTRCADLAEVHHLESYQFVSILARWGQITGVILTKGIK